MNGRTHYWRSLDEVAGNATFRDLVEPEFPGLQSLPTDEISRRRFLTLMSASLALAGAAGCAVQPAPRKSTSSESTTSALSRSKCVATGSPKPRTAAR